MITFYADRTGNEIFDAEEDISQNLGMLILDFDERIIQWFIDTEKDNSNENS